MSEIIDTSATREVATLCFENDRLRARVAELERRAFDPVQLAMVHEIAHRANQLHDLTIQRDASVNELSMLKKKAILALEAYEMACDAVGAGSGFDDLQYELEKRWDDQRNELKILLGI